MMAVWKTQMSVPVGSQVPVLFLDRDGVVIRDCDYLADPAGVALLPGAAAAMVRARKAGFLTVGVSNQSGIGRGYFSLADFEAVMARLETDLEAEQARFDGFFFCPHEPAADCVCRKPRLGLLDEAAAVFAWDPLRSWVIGDKASDVALGQTAGLGSVLVLTGHGAEEEAKVRSQWPTGDRVMIAADLAAAIELILEHENTVLKSEPNGDAS